MTPTPAAYPNYEAEQFAGHINDLENAIEETVALPPRVMDDHRKRYGMSFLIHLPLFSHIGNNALLDVNMKDKITGIDVVNVDYFPRFLLIPFKDLEAPIPAEGTAGYTASGSYESHARPFNPDAATADRIGGDRVTKTAKQCQDYAHIRYAEYGYTNLNSLIGIDDYKTAKQYLAKVLPLRDENFFPKIHRNILGESFLGPDLNQIVDFLTGPGSNRWHEMATSKEELEILRNLYAECLAGARLAHTTARATLAASEADIAATPQRKAGYDVRSHLYSNAPEPLDLLCMFLIGEQPKTDRALAQTQTQLNQANKPLSDMADVMSKMVDKMQGGVQTGLSADEIRQMISDGINAGVEDRMAKMMAERLTPPAETVDVVACSFPKEGGCRGRVLAGTEPPRCVSHPIEKDEKAN